MAEAMRLVLSLLRLPAPSGGPAGAVPTLGTSDPRSLTSPVLPHSADIDYSDLLPDRFALEAGNFYLQLASEADRRRVLAIIREHARRSR